MLKKEVFIVLFIFLLIINISTAQEYYADVFISVDNAGLTTINGETNHPLLNVESSPEFTSKEGKYWLINVSTDELFSNFVYELKLPKNANVNYMKLPDLARIEDSNSGLSIIGTGSNQKFEVVVQYSIAPISSSYLVLYSLIIILIIIVLVHFFLKKHKKIPKKKLPAMTSRQKQIYEIVFKNKKPMTQKHIQDIAKLPKSSISRNIETLVKKGVLKKEQMGMSNMISVNE